MALNAITYFSAQETAYVPFHHTLAIAAINSKSLT